MINRIAFIAGILSLLPFVASAAEEKPESPKLKTVKEIPLEDVLPCEADDELKVFSLKAEDGKNIQLGIVCDHGKLTAYPFALPPDLKVVE